MKFRLKSLFSLNPFSISLGITVLVVLSFLVGIPILDLIELKTYDLRFLSRGSVQPTAPVVLALIDEKSLDVEGRWPWPRSKFADLLNILSKDGAKVISFDVGFLEPDENSQLSLIRELNRQVASLEIKNHLLSEFLARTRMAADNDLLLARAIGNCAASVVLGYFFHMDEGSLGYKIGEKEIKEQLARINSSKYSLIIFEGQDTGVSPFIKAYAPESNLKIFTSKAAASGYFNVTTDRDGVVRWLPLVIQCGKEAFPPLSLLSAWFYLDKPQLMIKVAVYGVEGIQMGRRFIPTDENGQMLINYLGPPKTFPHYSITDILHGKLAAGTFKDKIVLVGATAMGTHDLRSTPFSPLYPGVEVHATVIDNIFSQNFITRPKWSKVYDLFAIIVLGFITAIAIPRMSALKGLLLASVLFICHIAIAQWLFVRSGVWLNIVYPLFVLSVTYLALTVYHYFTEERERKKIKGAFRHYVAPIVIEEMLREPGRLKLGGEEKVLTVLFSDLAGFTSYSERYAPHEMISILSDYFAEMTEQVFAYQGTLKEYVGDELMAIFGAPLDQEDHAQRACAAALAMRDALHRLREEWTKIGRPPLTARTGVNSGRMLIGNIGSRYRFAYGALGDQVNLGSRLEGLNKVYSTEILIGENTADLIGDSFQLREVDMVRVKGRQQPVRVYELLAEAGTSLPPEKKKGYAHFARGLELYRQQRWQEALTQFERVLEILPEDGPARVMKERCLIYCKSPPEGEWDGVFIARTK
ncbi:MAG: CHASE2 domain-containing protein [Deltaproteobacteria bacterium]|nr:CHASE2 domain-containing protein [Deltaproteobacteria bacterium]MBW2071008.1 CHASE2 domain-containing protein [Deltaproteobacteria bacterium]